MTSRETAADKEQFSGNELDESESGPQKAVQEEPVVQAVKKNAKAQKIIAATALTACLLAVLTYGLGRKPKGGENPLLKEVRHVAVVEDRIFVLEPFVVPFDGNTDYTYITMDFSFKLADKNLQEELIAKQKHIRKIIYDVLLREAGNAETVPPPEILKVIIRSEINRILANGQILEVYVTRYNAV